MIFTGYLGRGRHSPISSVFYCFFAHVRQLLDGPAIGAVWQMAAQDMCIQHVSRYTASLVFAAALANCLFALQAGIGLFLWHV